MLKQEGAQDTVAGRRARLLCAAFVAEMRSKLSEMRAETARVLDKGTEGICKSCLMKAISLFNITYIPLRCRPGHVVRGKRS